MEKVLGRRRAGGEGQEAHWLSVADLMAGLMMVFLFVAIALMRDAIQERDQIREIAVAYQENQVQIYEALMEEFEDDLEAWQASIDEDSLSFEFQSPEVLFERGSEEIRPRFEYILDDFFPRYLRILSEYRDDVIDEVRIEGHTSSEWTSQATDAHAYFLNMNLSQERTRTVLQYIYGLPDVASQQDWIKEQFAAVGFSSSRLKFTDEGQEDREASRRVTFRVVTNAETQVRSILEESD